MKRDPVRAALEALAEAAKRPDDPATLGLVARGPAADSKAAVEALQLYAHDEALQRRVHAALDARRPARRRPRREH